MPSIAFRALDDSIQSFKVPKGVNMYLAKRAIEKAHKGEDAALVDFGLTRTEVEFVASVVAKLEEHRPGSAS